jgi:L-alanine-DL-glutamate epimerase-like enolase superfamily enzyme
MDREATGDVTITGIQSLTFTHRSHVGRDEDGHAHPADEYEAQQTILRIQTSAGVEGFCVGGSPATAEVARRILSGLDPLDREYIHYRMREIQRIERQAFSDRNIGVIDQALWDVAGKLVGLPAHKILGGFRDRVPAYASTMCGDDIPEGLDTPEAYGTFAETCVEQGYKAFKLHTWMHPYGPDLSRDIAACQAVRDAVGPEIHLMLDPHHFYTREEALYLGRALEELDFHWIEEPMDEHSIASYVWLTENLDLPVVGPETAEGHIYTRAEWILRGAADISRFGMGLGGITPAMKAAHLCESFLMRMEIHGAGPGALQVLGAMSIPGEYYEKGLLHPHVDYDAERPWLKTPVDAIDEEGFVTIPQGPGLGVDLDWDYINDHAVTDWI